MFCFVFTSRAHLREIMIVLFGVLKYEDILFKNVFPHVLAFICAAGSVRQQCVKTHYASIMLEISMAALFMPKVLMASA